MSYSPTAQTHAHYCRQSDTIVAQLGCHSKQKQRNTLLGDLVNFLILSCRAAIHFLH